MVKKSKKQGKCVPRELVLKPTKINGWPACFNEQSVDILSCGKSLRETNNEHTLRPSESHGSKNHGEPLIYRSQNSTAPERRFFSVFGEVTSSRACFITSRWNRGKLQLLRRTAANVIQSAWAKNWRKKTTVYSWQTRTSSRIVAWQRHIASDGKRHRNESGTPCKRHPANSPDARCSIPDYHLFRFNASSDVHIQSVDKILGSLHSVNFILLSLISFIIHTTSNKNNNNKKKNISHLSFDTRFFHICYVVLEYYWKIEQFISTTPPSPRSPFVNAN